MTAHVHSPFRRFAVGRAVLAAFVALGAVAAAAPALALNIGYYEMCSGQGVASQVTPIEAAGHAAIQLTTLSAIELLTVDVAFVNNCNNGGYGGEYLAQLPVVQAAVNDGMVLVLHDRYVSAAETILPGGATFDVRRDFADDANIDVLDATTLVTNGPGGIITNATLDGGTSSSHGFAVSGSLPVDAVRILSTGSPGNIVTFSYRFGAGGVVYSSIPLDYYLYGGKAEFGAIYAPNVLAYAADLNSCGNGQLDGGEDCDDGNKVDGDCCSSACAFETAGTSCANDENSCTDDACDGAGACTHDANAAACNDGNACTLGDTCGNGQCGAGLLVTSCTGGDGCCIPGCTATQDSDCPALEILDYVSRIVDDSIDPMNGVNGLYEGRDIAISPDGQTVYVAAFVDNAIGVFDRDAGTGAVTWVEAELGANAALSRVSTVAVSPDGLHVYAGNQFFAQSGVSLFDRNPSTGALTYVDVYRQAGLDSVLSIVISADGENLYASSFDDRVVVYSRNAATGVLTSIQTFQDGVDGVDGLNNSRDLAVSPDGAHVYVTGTDDHAVAIFSRDAMSGELTFVTAMFDDAPGSAFLHRADGVAVSGDGKFVYISSFDEDLNVFSRDSITGLLTYVRRFPQAGGPGPLAVSPDDGRVYVSSWVIVLDVFGRDVVSGEHTFLESKIEGIDGVDGIQGMQGIAVSPDGLDVYTGSQGDRALTHFRVRCGDSVLDVGEACDDGNGAGGDGCASNCTVEFCWTCTAVPSVQSVCTPDEGKVCDDGLFCTGSGGDTCQAGVCTGPLRTCDDANQCTLDTCDEAANACTQDGPALNGVACDDGAWCTVGDFCLASACLSGGARECGDDQDCTDDSCNEAADACTNAAKVDGSACASGATCVSGESCSVGVCGSGTPDATTCVDDYLCYKAAVTRGQPKFTPVEGVSLDDALEAMAADVRKPLQLCAPADDGGAGVHDATTHLLGYQAKAVKGEAKYVPRIGVAIVDRFGSLVVDTVKRRQILVATSRQLGAAAPELPTTSKLDDFKCYGIKLSASSPPLQDDLQASIDDALSGAAVLLDIRKPKALCVPVDRDGNEIEEPLAHLMCYQVAPAKGQPKYEPIEGQIHTLDDFGAGRLDTKKADTLCVPAVVTDLP